MRSMRMLHELKRERQPHPLRKCFRKRAQDDFVFERYGPKLYGEDSLMVKLLLYFQEKSAEECKHIKEDIIIKL